MKVEETTGAGTLAAGGTAAASNTTTAALTDSTTAAAAAAAPSCSANKPSKKMFEGQRLSERDSECGRCRGPSQWRAQRFAG